ncbi:MAG: ThiF family adenylyltransferase [Planctomycetota bacterium]
MNGQLVVAAEALNGLERGMPKKVSFVGRPDERVFHLLGDGVSHANFPGSVSAIDGPNCSQGTVSGFEEDQVRLLVKWDDIEPGNVLPEALAAHSRGLVKTQDGWEPIPVEIISFREELFSRFGGLLETKVLANCRVAIFGLGSGGSYIAIELAKSAVGHFDLIDHDRLEVGNVARHQCDLADIGRLKVKAMADAIRRKNPSAEVTTWSFKAEWERFETVLEIVRGVDLVFAATDNHASKLLINQACVQEGKTCIFAGAHRRAHGGQVIRVRPHKSICFQCFSMLLPEQAQDQEISSEEHAERLAYTDRPVPIEPGLSNDIAPISQMAVKIGIQELLQGKPTTFGSLDQDLVADWYLWLNRREAGTQFEKLKPLEFNVDGMHIMRWYGIEIDRHEGCPVCGDFEANFSEENFGLLNAVKDSPMNSI